MSPPLATEALQTLVSKAKSRQALGADLPADDFVRSLQAERPQMYRNHNERLNIDFTVERLGFAEQQTMDPRVVRIAPQRNNELHKHAHESLFVVLEGEGEVRLGEAWRTVRAGDFVFVPRWIFHQTRNTSARNELVVLAVTDFGFTSAILGDYDKRTRLSQSGDQASSDTVTLITSPPKPPKRSFFSWLFGT
ncbi:MAG: cupin domain-containing protein [Myxococcota bacterium]